MSLCTDSGAEGRVVGSVLVSAACVGGGGGAALVLAYVLLVWMSPETWDGKSASVI